MHPYSCKRLADGPKLDPGYWKGGGGGGVGGGAGLQLASMRSTRSIGATRATVTCKRWMSNGMRILSIAGFFPRGKIWVDSDFRGVNFRRWPQI